MQVLNAKPMPVAVSRPHCDRVAVASVGNSRTRLAPLRAKHREIDSATHELPKQLAAGVMTAVTAVALTVAPSAQAVSGGGGIGTPISGMDFSNQDLRQRSFTKAVMRQTNFSNSNLSGVSFFGGLALGANFHAANLTNADLESGDFEGADFSDAILAGAYIQNAQWTNANLKNTDWTDVQMRKDVQKLLCSMVEGVNPTTGVDSKESLLCP